MYNNKNNGSSTPFFNVRANEMDVIKKCGCGLTRTGDTDHFCILFKMEPVRRQPVFGGPTSAFTRFQRHVHVTPHVVVSPESSCVAAQTSRDSQRFIAKRM